MVLYKYTHIINDCVCDLNARDQFVKQFTMCGITALGRQERQKPVAGSNQDRTIFNTYHDDDWFYNILLFY